MPHHLGDAAAKFLAALRQAVETVTANQQVRGPRASPPLRATPDVWHVCSHAQCAGGGGGGGGHLQLAKKGSAAMYGMVASVPDKGLVDDFIVSFFSAIYTPST